MAAKILYLVRHGQSARKWFASDPLGEPLTELGKHQAYLVAQRLRQYPIHCLHYSSLRRAAETATAIATALPSIPLHSSELLWECNMAIFAATNAPSGDTMSPEQRETMHQRVETAFQTYFTPSPTNSSHEILVCHGNLIRYFVSRVLQIAPSLFSTVEIANGSISIVVVENERIQLISYNDVGHLPLSAQTYIRFTPT